MQIFKQVTVAAAIALAAGTATAANADRITYKLDPHHTSVVASWNHFGFSNPIATFSGVTGTLVFDDENPDKSSVNVTIPVTSVNTHVDSLNKEFQGKDFFDTAEYPTATFKSISVDKRGENHYVVTGDLTLKGKTQPLVLQADLNKQGINPMAKLPAIGFDARATLKRSDFGIDAYVPNVSDQVTLRISTEGVEQ